MASEPYKPSKAEDLMRIEARRRAAGITLQALCDKASISVANYRRIRGSGRAFKRTVNALAMALRTLESEARRESDIFPFGSGPGQPRPFAAAPARPSAGASSSSSAAGSRPASSRSRR